MHAVLDENNSFFFSIFNVKWTFNVGGSKGSAASLGNKSSQISCEISGVPCDGLIAFL